MEANSAGKRWTGKMLSMCGIQDEKFGEKSKEVQQKVAFGSGKGLVRRASGPRIEDRKDS